MTLAELFRKYLTAKPSAYGPAYEAIPAPTRVLELGVKAGGSLLAWAEYWPDAEVYGVDIDLALVRPEVFAHPRIIVLKANALDPLSVPPGLYDLIVDDVGLTSHILSDQLAIMRNYVYLVAPGGTYVVEDVTSDNGLSLLCAQAERLGLETVNVLRPPGLEFRLLTLRRPE